MLTDSIPSITPKDAKVPKPHCSKYECPIIFRPTKLSNTPNPNGKKRNKPIRLDRKKNNDLNPMTAKTLLKKTTYGSLEIEKIAGIESTANNKSVNAITTTTTKMCVINKLPDFILTKKRPITFLL